VLLIGAGNLGRALMAYNGFDAKGFRLVAVFDIDPGKIGKKQGPFVAAAPVAESTLAQSRVPAAKGSNPVPSKLATELPKVERVERSFTIQPISELKATVEKLSIRLAILAVPAEVAQDVADEAVAAGVRGILNFAPVSLTVPKDVALNAVDLAVQLEQLSYQVNFSPKV
jgi:redox-sensing transcriptional repressor